MNSIEELNKIANVQKNNGYYKTRFGSLPCEWKLVKLSEIIEKLDAGVSVNSEDRPAEDEEYGVLKTSAVNNGKFIPTENKLIKEDDIKRAKLNPVKGSIIISRMNTPELVGEIGYVETNYKNLFLPDRLWQTTFRGKVSGKWLANILILPFFKKQIENIATGTSNSMKNISKNAFLSLEVPFPSFHEQQKIAEILSTWDKAIELKEKLIEQKKEQKKGLMQKLLTGEVRLPGFNDKWIKVEFGKVLKFLKKEPVKNPQDYYLLTVKLHLKGVDATDKKPNVTTNGRPYYLREPNELLIGRQNFHNGGIGIVPEDMKNYVASNAISSVGAIKGNLRFYYYYLSNANFYKRIEHIIGGTGQKEISESMMKKLKLFIPQSEKEQTAIANVLGMVDKEIDLLEEELLQLKQQKKGLMQLLLTGKVRVKV